MKIISLREVSARWQRILLSVVLAVALPAFAESYSARDEQGNVVRISDEPCADTPAWMNLKKAEMHYRGKDYKACWVSVGGVVIVFDDNGDATPVPAQMFTKDVRS
jgi:hypothetical protein